MKGGRGERRGVGKRGGGRRESTISVHVHMFKVQIHVFGYIRCVYKSCLSQLIFFSWEKKGIVFGHSCFALSCLVD